MERIILSLDIGTSSCKAVLFSEAGRELCSGKGHYPLHYRTGRRHVEQSPEEIWEGVCFAIRELGRATSRMGNIQAVALSGQISSHFFIDKQGQPLTPIMTWMDSRAVTEAREMGIAFSPQELLEGLGSEMRVSPSWPAPKLRWAGKHIPQVLEQAHFLVQPKDWVLWKLTSIWRTDLSSLRGLIHQTTGQPFDKLMQWAGARNSIFPTLGDPSEIVGVVEPSVADSLGLPQNVPVVLGWNDLNTSVLGTVGFGNQEVRGYDMTGTSEHIGILDSTFWLPSAPGASGINWIPFLSTHVLQYGASSAGGQALKWFVEQIDQPGSTEKHYDSVFEQAQGVSPGSEGLLFLPYLSGERSPWWDSDVRGTFFGLHLQHDRRHMARAVMEGVGYGLRAIYDRLERQPETIVTSGGLSRSKTWNQIKANILGVPLVQSESSEAGCLGAAILAAYGLGWYGTLAEACTAMLRTGEVIEPQVRYSAVYENNYSTFLQLYQSLRPLYAQQSTMTSEGD
jgi:xylulokinase